MLWSTPGSMPDRTEGAGVLRTPWSGSGTCAGGGGPFPRRPHTHRRRTAMDEDLRTMSRDELVAEVMKLRAGIRSHRDASEHDLCWHHPDLWSLLPERSDPLPVVPAWPQFMRGCIRYRQSLDEQAADAPRTVREP